MDLFKARVKLFLHSLFRFHKKATYRNGRKSRPMAIGCSNCRKVFWSVNRHSRRFMEKALEGSNQ